MANMLEDIVEVMEIEVEAFTQLLDLMHHVLGAQEILLTHISKLETDLLAHQMPEQRKKTLHTTASNNLEEVW